MTDQSIFGNEPNPQVTPANGAPAGTTPQNANPFADMLGMIRNESGELKYKNIPDALNGLAHSQSFIETLKREKADLEAKLALTSASADKQAELERTVAELLQKQTTTSATPTGNMTPEQIAEMVNRTLQERETKQSAAKNTSEVVNALKQSYGDDAEAKYNAAATELGLTVAELNVMAAKSPKAVLKALGIAGQSNTPSKLPVPGHNAVNTAGFQPNQETFVGRNKKVLPLGATTQELNQESFDSKKMVDELHAAGLDTSDLTDPKVYFKYFGK